MFDSDWLAFGSLRGVVFKMAAAMMMM